MASTGKYEVRRHPFVILFFFRIRVQKVRKFVYPKKTHKPKGVEYFSRKSFDKKLQHWKLII